MDAQAAATQAAYRAQKSRQRFACKGFYIAAILLISMPFGAHNVLPLLFFSMCRRGLRLKIT